jgi:hypothetical protein
MWPPVCDLCGETLEEPGALVFSPPDEHGAVSKYHVCKCKCWQAVRELLFGAKPEGGPHSGG